MKPLFLPVACVAALTVTGWTSVFAQTSLELLDHARKDLETRYATVREANAKKAKEMESTPTPRPSLADNESRASEYNLQSGLDYLGQLREYLEAGNDDAAVQALHGARAASQLPDNVKTALDSIAQRLRAERAARDAALVTEVDAAWQRASEAVSRAKEPKDLDPMLQELIQLSGKQNGNRYYDNGNNRAVAKLQAANNFVSRWQDYLLARNRNEDSNAAGILRNLTENSSQPLLIPRSEILALLPQKSPESEPPKPTPRPPQRPQEQIDAEAVAIVEQTKKLEDVSASLAKLAALRREITSRQSYSINSDSDFGGALTSLQALQRNYLEIQNGLETTVSLGYSRSELNSRPSIENALLPLRVQLVKLAAPRMLGAPEGEKAAEGEGLDAYLRRLIEAAKKRQDWAAVVRGLELKHTLATLTATTTTTTTDETGAFKNFFAARNLESAGQYEQAVITYLTALRSGQQDLPAAIIGERLAVLEKAHPTEYASGSKYVLNPPPSNYPDFSRFGPPGAVGPGFMGRGAGGDPRFFNRFGIPPQPADESLAVPAAAPSPKPASTAAPEASPAARTPAPSATPGS